MLIGPDLDSELLGLIQWSFDEIDGYSRRIMRYLVAERYLDVLLKSSPLRQAA